MSASSTWTTHMVYVYMSKKAIMDLMIYIVFINNIVCQNSKNVKIINIGKRGNKGSMVNKGSRVNKVNGQEGYPYHAI